MKTMRSRKPDNAVEDRAFSQAVKRRDGGVCQMQRWDGEAYRMHGIKGTGLNPIDASHIYPRSQLSPGTMFYPIIGLASCRDCHDKYGAHDDSVRVPPARESSAWTYLKRANQLGALKVMPVRREPPKRPA